MIKTETILQRIYKAEDPRAADIEYLLSRESSDEVGMIFRFADSVRRAHAGDGILARGIIEFSNYCANSCAYCGLNRNNKSLKRYRLSHDEIFKSILKMVSLGIKTVVLQSGEDFSMEALLLKETIEEIKARFDVALTLSVGERSARDYRLWRKAGADRYLLKIETTNRRLYESLHAGMSFQQRINCLKALQDLGYQTGSGVIVGLKGQTLRMLAEDIVFFKKNNFDMIGIGPFIPHPATKLKNQAQADVSLTLKTLALTRIVTKNAHLPATTALGSIGKRDFKIDGLRAGANVIMLNFTPPEYSRLYEIYPGKGNHDGLIASYESYMRGLSEATGRPFDFARGDSLVQVTDNR
ncbi:MAG: [FeFe] hydrogenase H-cluster radical SAM maturase HydE [Candidatus Omnitrophota bacterium]|jgi:biotin synthase